MNEDFQLIKNGLLEVEDKLDENAKPTLEDLRQAILALNSAVVLLTEEVHKHVWFPHA